MRFVVGFGDERGEGRYENLPEGFWRDFVTVAVVVVVELVEDEVEVLRD